MAKKTTDLSKRMKYVKKAYDTVENGINVLPISEDNKERILTALLGNEDLRNFMNGIETNRPPRFLLIGRTGAGKSSLINALCNCYIAKVSDTKSCTEGIEIIPYEENGRELMKICDTRGIAESKRLNEDESAEKALLNQIDRFMPDVAILLLNCIHRDDINSDVIFLKKIKDIYYKKYKKDLPVVVVLNRADGVAPDRIKNPNEYTKNKIDSIYEIVNYYRAIIEDNGLEIDDDKIIPVSSLIDWMTPDGEEIPVEQINNLPKKEVNELEIAFDGRYNIDKLYDILLNSIEDFGGQMGFRMATCEKEACHRLAVYLVDTFATVASTITAFSLPVSDYAILLAIQVFLVVLIAALGGRELTLDTAKDFIVGLIGQAGAGYTFKALANGFAKVFVGAGNLIYAGFAASGTKAIGSAAIAYYIDEKDLEDVENFFRKQTKNLSKENKKEKRSKAK